MPSLSKERSKDIQDEKVFSNGRSGHLYLRRKCNDILYQASGSSTPQLSNVLSTADYGIADPDHRNQTGTYWLLYDLNLTITNERAISDEELAVKSVGSDKVASAEYFDMQGRRVSANHKGVTLMKTRMADGSVSSRKLVRK